MSGFQTWHNIQRQSYQHISAPIKAIPSWLLFRVALADSWEQSPSGITSSHGEGLFVPAPIQEMPRGILVPDMQISLHSWKRNWRELRLQNLDLAVCVTKTTKYPEPTCIKSVPTLSLGSGDSDQSASSYLHSLSVMSLPTEIWQKYL